MSTELTRAGGCTVNDLRTLIDQGKTFGTVYADPPWPYGNQGTRAATGNHYVTMSVKDITALPVRQLAAADAHLHLWTTNAFLFDVPRILDAWGFEYKSVFVWCKPNIGMGNYWRVSHEFLVFALRGDAPFRSRELKSWREMKRGEHSSKPEQVRHMIESTSPGPYLELFGRDAVSNWCVWGNAVERDLFTRELQAL